MSRSEIRIDVKPLTREEQHTLVSLIARCGYSPYFTYNDEGVAFTVDDDEGVTKLKERGE